MTQSLDELLRAAVARHPDRVAVSCGAETLRYADLDRRSDSLASVLAAHGARPGERVALDLDKSLDTVAAAFGVLRSGAAYVPLDPAGPVERRRKIVADCGPSIVIAAARQVSGVRALLARPTSLRAAIVPDSDDAALRGELAPLSVALAGDVERAGPSPSRGEPRSDAALAYVLYTSGSTGRPKGVAVSHRAALAFVEWAATAFSLSHQDTVSWHAPLQFDLSVFDLFASIRAGARICVVPQGASVFPASVATLIERERITTWYSVPSALVQLARHGQLDRRDLSALRQVLFAGEPFPAPRLRELMRLLPHVRFHNLYGPTETNVCTWHALDAPPGPDESLPIGRPCAGDSVAVLADDGSPAPAGAIGELVVGGPTLMDGYWNDPDATRRVLRRDRSGALRCFTGDLARLRPDGELEFHGRRDSMLKARGYRVELGEVEAVLHEHPDVAEALVVAVANEELGHVLHAAVVAGDGRALDVSGLRRFCAQRLPACMRPETITVLAGPLPRTPTGKLDRQAVAASLRPERP